MMMGALLTLSRSRHALPTISRTLDRVPRICASSVWSSLQPGSFSSRPARERAISSSVSLYAELTIESLPFVSSAEGVTSLMPIEKPLLPVRPLELEIIINRDHENALNHLAASFAIRFIAAAASFGP